jgi:hypothetical protein
MLCVIPKFFAQLAYEHIDTAIYGRPITACQKLQNCIARQNALVIKRLRYVVVGVKGRANLSGDWFLPFYLDVGTGDSDLTWQALAGVGYRFDWGDVSLTYRYLKWDLGSSSPIDDISFGGPQLTATFRF